MFKSKLTPAQEQEVLRLHHAEHVSTGDIGKVYGVSSNTIWRILRRFGAVRRPKCSKAEQKIIRRMTLRRKKQREIAVVLSRSVAFVKAWQEKLNCRRWQLLTPQVEKEIITLYKSGLGQARVGKLVRVSQPQVRRVLLRHGIPLHKTSRPPMLTGPKRQEAISLIRARGTYCKDIAKKLGVSRDSVEKLAHNVTGCSRFLGGAIWPPLQSAFPQRHQAWTANDFVRLLAIVFPGGLPAQSDYALVPRIISVLLQTFPFWREATTPELVNVENHLLAAMGTMRAESESALVH